MYVVGGNEHHRVVKVWHKGIVFRKRNAENCPVVDVHPAGLVAGYGVIKSSVTRLRFTFSFVSEKYRQFANELRWSWFVIRSVKVLHIS